MRIGSEAPKRRTHSSLRHKSHGNISGPRHLERHRRPVTSERTRPNLSGAFSDLGSLRRAQNDTFWHHALSPKPPQGDQKLARQGHDHGLATLASFAMRVKNWVSTGPSCRDRRVGFETRERVHNRQRSYIRRARKVSRKMQREGLLPMKPQVALGAGPGKR
jgi:hypothetical protein